MFDVALSQAGAKISLATSSDWANPPENMLDGQSETFWSTTGLYPQEFIVSFESRMDLRSVIIHCYNVRDLTIYKSSQNDLSDFEKIESRELEMNEGQLQKEEIPLSRTVAQHLKFVINSGYDHFSSVHKVSVEGSAAKYPLSNNTC